MTTITVLKFSISRISIFIKLSGEILKKKKHLEFKIRIFQSVVISYTIHWQNDKSHPTVD